MAKRTRWPPHLTGSLGATCRNAAAPLAQRQVVGWLIAIGMIGLLIFGPGTYQLISLSIREHRLDRRLSELEAERERLTAQESRLRNDPAYVEGLIRTTFKVSKPGEYVIPLDTSQADDNAR